MDNSRKADLAYRRYFPLATGGSPVTYDELRKYYRDKWGEKYSNQTIEAAVKDAFRLGLVEIRKIDEEFGIPEFARDATLEADLKLRFPKVREFIVIKPNSSEEDRTHLELGLACAKRLMEIFAFNREDHIGVGAGRAVRFFVDGCHRMRVRDQCLEDVVVYSLSGNLHPGVDDFADADQNATLLREYLSHGARHVPVGSSLVELEAPALRERFYANIQDIDHAVLGVGVLAAGHRLFQAHSHIAHAIESLPGSDRNSKFLENPEFLQACHKENFRAEMYESLDRLIRNSQELKSSAESYEPIGDISNRLLVVPPTPSQREQLAKKGKTPLLEELTEQVREFNYHLLTLDVRHLNKIRKVSLIAGGTNKAGVVTTLLEGDTPVEEEQIKPRVFMAVLDCALAESALSLLDQKL